MTPKVDPDNPPEAFWFELVMRGNKQVIVIYFGAWPRGSFEVNTPEELEAWETHLQDVNLTLAKLYAR